MSVSFSIDKFKVNSAFDLNCLPIQDDKVCVISVIGKSRYDQHSSKATIINSVIDSNAFLGSYGSCWTSEDKLCLLEGYYDADQRIICLHLQSVYDTVVMADLCRIAENDVSTSGYAGLLRMAEYAHTRALLFLFLVSHIILLVQPGSSFDLSYVRLFRTLEAVRQKMQPTVTDLLKRLIRSNNAIGISKDWVSAGRPCSPRLLFVFEGCRISQQEEDTAAGNRSHRQRMPPVKALQHAIEDQIYRILRKARIITNTSNNSLFAVPANQEFVYIRPQSRDDTGDLVKYYLDQLHSSCQLTQTASSSSSHSYLISRHPGTSHSAGSLDTEDGTLATSSGSAASTAAESAAVAVPTFSRCTKSGSSSAFVDWLMEHVELALTHGFDDNVGRNPVPAIFELATVADWFAVVHQLHHVFWADIPVDSRLHSYFTLLKSLSDTDVRFSESRCSKVLPLALGVYQDGLPPHYVHAVHLAKLQQAKRAFAMQARGPACERYLEQLTQECEELWKNGRQMCEEMSLTGNHCVNELHRVLDMVEMSDEVRKLPVMPHSSQVKTRATCNCGRRQGEREDPFDHRLANYEFFERLEQVCCGQLMHYEMSVFKPSTSDIRPASFCDTATRQLEDSVSRTSSHRSVKVDSAAVSSLSLALSLSQTTDMFHEPAIQSELSQDNDDSATTAAAAAAADNDDDDDVDADRHTVDEDEEAELEEGGVASGDEDHVVETVDEMLVITAQRQHSTTEYLPGMLHSNSPPGLLPKFPSWSLLQLGEYSAYNPSAGVDQPGFTRGCNYLLPVDITLKLDRSAAADSLSLAKKGQKLRKPAAKDVVDMVFRLFVGLEYECPRGHRFFLCAPDRLFKVPPTGIYKETGYRVLNHDMPMYFPCTCRSVVPMIGQLMRIHLAIPDGPIEAKIRPKVQPGPAPCPLFFPEAEEPITLHPGLWILRLPYVYLGESGVYRTPAEPQPNVLSAKFVRGFLSVVEAASVTG